LGLQSSFSPLRSSWFSEPSTTWLSSRLSSPQAVHNSDGVVQFFPFSFPKPSSLLFPPLEPSRQRPFFFVLLFEFFVLRYPPFKYGPPPFRAKNSTSRVPKSFYLRFFPSGGLDTIFDFPADLPPFSSLGFFTRYLTFLLTGGSVLIPLCLLNPGFPHFPRPSVRHSLFPFWRVSPLPSFPCLDFIPPDPGAFPLVGNIAHRSFLTLCRVFPPRLWPSLPGLYPLRVFLTTLSSLLGTFTIDRVSFFFCVGGPVFLVTACPLFFHLPKTFFLPPFLIFFFFFQKLPNCVGLFCRVAVSTLFPLLIF